MLPSHSLGSATGMWMSFTSYSTLTIYRTRNSRSRPESATSTHLMSTSSQSLALLTAQSTTSLPRSAPWSRANLVRLSSCRLRGADGPSPLWEASLRTFCAASMDLWSSWVHVGPQPTLVRVIERNASPAANDTQMERYLASMSGLLSKLTKHKVPYTLQHHHDVGVAVCAHASNIEASLIVTSTHGHTGMARFVLGSTAAAFVRDAPCPVLLVRPAHTDPSEVLPRTRR
jgi:nucleotide-binding universal stress UspA family protein